MVVPPPSKSYLMTFDSSSEEESDLDHESTQQQKEEEILAAKRQEIIRNIELHRQREAEKEKQEQESKSTGLLSYLKSLTGTEIESKESQPSETEKTQKKKKKKKKKRKKKSGSKSPQETESVSTCTTRKSSTCKGVSFSHVKVSEFYRDVHTDGVPADGGYPLGLSNKLHKSFQIDIDTFEEKKQLDLKQRYQDYVKHRRERCAKKDHVNTRSSSRRRKRSNSKVGNEMHSKNSLKEELKNSSQSCDKKEPPVPVYIPDNFEFETRQFDHRERHSDDHRYEGKANETILEWKEIYGTGRNVLFGQLMELERKTLHERDAAMHIEDFIDDNDNDRPSSPKKGGRRRKQSVSIEEVYLTLDVQHIKHDLENIRISRTSKDAAGCSCRKLHVVLPNELGPGGKKSHHHRRMKEGKVKEELRRRNIEIPYNAKREELELLLHDEVEKHGCCFDEECPCFKNGIGCQADTCSCWHTSHVSHKKGGATDANVTPDEANTRCGNPEGIYMVDFSAIETYRDQFITAKEKGICGVTSS